MQIAGDEELADDARRQLGRHHPVAVVAAVTPAGARAAVLGGALDADVEIGSVSKGLTGLLYVDALERGEVTPATRLGEHLPLDGAPAAAVRLADLATHRSGLPRLPASARPWRRTLELWRRGTNPYGESLAELVDQARGVRLGRPRPRYSNLGFELLGHALAAAAGTTYADLLRTRLAEPLGLDVAYAPASPAGLRPQALSGRSRRGRVMSPWTGEAIAPAGGVRMTAAALAGLLTAVAAGNAPGAAALDPVAPFGWGARIGAAWITTTAGGQAVTWHNGGTGGFRSWLGVDRAAGCGVALVSATARSVDRHGFALLAALRDRAG